MLKAIEQKAALQGEPQILQLFLDDDNGSIGADPSEVDVEAVGKPDIGISTIESLRYINPASLAFGELTSCSAA